MEQNRSVGEKRGVETKPLGFLDMLDSVGLPGFPRRHGTSLDSRRSMGELRPFKRGGSAHGFSQDRSPALPAAVSIHPS